jgi:hypothetical protein
MSLRFMRTLLPISFCVILGACGFRAPPSIDPDAVGWLTYTDTSLGISVPYPDIYRVESSDDGSYVAFRHRSFTPMIIRFVDEQDGRQRGLWFASKPAGESLLGGVPAQRYIYKHYDGPFGARMIAYVIPYKGKYLGMEFRSNGGLDRAQEKILAQVKITGSP